MEQPTASSTSRLVCRRECAGAPACRPANELHSATGNKSDLVADHCAHLTKQAPARPKHHVNKGYQSLLLKGPTKNASQNYSRDPRAHDAAAFSQKPSPSHAGREGRVFRASAPARRATAPRLRRRHISIPVQGIAAVRGGPTAVAVAAVAARRRRGQRWRRRGRARVVDLHRRSMGAACAR